MVVVLIGRRFLVVVDMTRSSPIIIERTPEITMQIDLKSQIVTEDSEALSADRKKPAVEVQLLQRVFRLYSVHGDRPNPRTYSSPM